MESAYRSGGDVAWADRIGLCSVTFRALPAVEVAALAEAAGLRVVEWGADVHAPPGEPDTLRALRDRTPRPCSYGSYWRAGAHDPADLVAVADAAVLLGAPRIRVWAGAVGSAEATADQRAAVVGALRDGAGTAAAHGLALALEFHGGTLTDTVESTLRLLDEVGHPALSSYWQPPVDLPDDQAVAGLRAVLDRVSAVHVFSWWPGTRRLPLAAREGLWRRVVEVLADRPPLDLLLEFVPDDDPAALAAEAATLRSWLPA
jgi:sugar phosphate isomerase/epimerase